MRREFEDCRIYVIDWPAFSLDLNPIETVWNWLKDYVEEHFAEKLSYDALRTAVREAWNAVSADFFKELLASMQVRLDALIKANGMHIPF